MRTLCAFGSAWIKTLAEQCAGLQNTLTSCDATTTPTYHTNTRCDICADFSANALSLASSDIQSLFRVKRQPKQGTFKNSRQQTLRSVVFAYLFINYTLHNINPCCFRDIKSRYHITVTSSSHITVPLRRTLCYCATVDTTSVLSRRSQVQLLSYRRQIFATFCCLFTICIDCFASLCRTCETLEATVRPHP